MDIISILLKAFALKNAFKGLILEPLKKVKDYTEQHDYQDVIELSHFFKKGKIPYGTIVNLEGIGSEYSHTYKPYTYMPYFPLILGIERLGIKERLKFTSGIFQPPVETIPEVSYNGKAYKLGFIYPNEFSSFTYESNFNNISESQIAGKPYLHIPEEAKPVPIIYDHRFSLYTGDSYNIKAKVVELPIDHLLYITKHYNDFMIDVHERYLNLYSAGQKSICLLVDGDQTKFKRIEKYAPTTLKISLFVEGHLTPTNATKNSYELIDKSVPSNIGNRVPFNSFSITKDHVILKSGCDRLGDTDERTAYFTYGDVRVLQRDPDTVSFYVEVNIADSHDYQNKIKSLATSIKKFDQNVQNLSNRKVRYSVDFISDKRLIPLLNLPRVQESEEVHKIFKSNPEFTHIKQWYTR